MAWTPPASTAGDTVAGGSIALSHRVDGSGALALRWVRLVAGLWLFAAGLAAMIRAGLGLSSWDVLHDALRGLTPLSFGGVIVVVSILVLGASMSLGIRPGPGTVANALLVGPFTDLLLATAAGGGLATGPLLPRVVVLLAGIWAIAFGSAVYIGADLGSGPRDGLMLGVAKRSGFTAGRARSGIELVVVLAGIILGGALGIGTLVFVVLIGPAIDASFRALGMQPRRSAPRSLLPSRARSR